ncbi:MAG: hypothetical protein AABX93_00065 [Nanoarchaeota archaeon]
MVTDKRGLSTIIVTLLIIVLSLAGIGILGVIIQNLIKEGASDVDLSSKCLEVDVALTKTDCNPGTNGDDCDITVIRNDNGDDIAGLKLVLTNETATTNYRYDAVGNIDPLETKTFSVTGTGISDVNKVDVVTYFKDETGNEQLCPLK